MGQIMYPHSIRTSLQLILNQLNPIRVADMLMINLFDFNRQNPQSHTYLFKVFLLINCKLN